MKKLSADTAKKIVDIIMDLPNGGCMTKAMAYSFCGLCHLKDFGVLYQDAMELTQVQLGGGTMSIILREKL